MSQLQQRSAVPPAETAIEVEVSAPLVPDVSALASIQGPLRFALRHLGETLGIPRLGDLPVRVTESAEPLDKPLIVRVNGHRVRYSRELSATLAHYLGSPPDEIHRDTERFPEYLTELAVEVVKLRPALLLGPTQLANYRDALRAHGHHAAAESPYLEGALRLALRLWLSISDINKVAAALHDLPADADETRARESVVQALRQDELEIQLPLGYLRQLTDVPEDWTEDFSKLRSALARELGITVPSFSIVLNPELHRADEEQGQSFCFKFNALTTTPIRGLARDEILVNDIVDRVQQSDLPAIATINAATGRAASIVKLHQRPRLEAAGQTTWDARQYVVLCLADAIRARAALLFDQSTVEELLTTFRSQAPQLGGVIDALYSTADVTAVLRELLGDRISIRNIARICDLLADADGEASFDDRVNVVRAGMREIGNRLSRSTNVVPVYLLDVSIVDLLERTPSIGLDEEYETALTDAIQAELNHLPNITPPAIVATAKSRALLQEVLSDPFPRVPVTTLAELSDDVGVQPIARIALAHS